MCSLTQKKEEDYTKATSLISIKFSSRCVLTQTTAEWILVAKSERSSSTKLVLRLKYDLREKKIAPESEAFVGGEVMF